MAAFRRVGHQGRDRDVGGGVLMLLEHTPIIHFVDVVAREDDHVLRLLRADRINVLVNRVGRPHVPVLADPLHRRQDFDELADFSPENVPAFANLPIQRQRLVLRQDKHPAQARVDAVGKRDVDDAVNAAEGYGRLRAVARQWHRPRSGGRIRPPLRAVTEVSARQSALAVHDLAALDAARGVTGINHQLGLVHDLLVVVVAVVGDDQHAVVLVKIIE